MNSKFKPQSNSNDSQSLDPGSEGEFRILKIDSGKKPIVTEFTFDKIKSSERENYSAVKKKFGAMAATDYDRKKLKEKLSVKDSRFSINAISKTALSIDEEELRAIEEKVKRRVSDLSEEAKENAFTIGYEEGLKKGYKEAYEKHQLEGKNKIEQFEKFISECESAKKDLFIANERFLIEIVFRVARLILLKELSTDREYILRLTKELIEKVGVRENIKIRLNAEDMATAVQLKEGLEKSLGVLTNLSVEVSNQVHRGGCMIETEWNAIDASIETQLQGIYAAFIG